MPPDKNDCFWESDKVKLSEQLTELSIAVSLLADWRKEHENSAKIRQKQTDALLALVHGQAESMVRMEGNLALIQQAVNSCAKTINEKSTENAEKEKKLKEAYCGFVKTVILFIGTSIIGCGGIVFFLGNTNHNVKMNTECCTRSTKHIKIDEARWDFFPIEDQKRKLNE